jgi:catabolite regulation protein CreA
MLLFQQPKVIGASFLAAAFFVAQSLTFLPSASAADGSRVVGEIKGSGLVFKDTLKIESFDDPKVKGVTLYLTNFERPITERLQKDFFSDPSASSLTCVRSGPIAIADNIGTGTSGEEVFEESRSLLFKQLRVRRIYDKEKNAVVYVTYNTRLNKNDDENRSRFKTSICSVSLLDETAKAEIKTQE